MKKVFSFLAVLALVAMASSAIWADNVLPTPKKAYISFSEGDVTVSVDLYNLPDTYSEGFYANPGTPLSGDNAKISFYIGSDFALGSNTIYNSSGTVFAKIHTNLSGMKAGSKLDMYTNNQTNGGIGTVAYSVNANSQRTEQWSSDVTALVYNGLIRGNSKATTSDEGFDQGDYAPIQMYFCKVSDADKTGYQFSKANYPNVWDGYGRKGLLDYNDTANTQSVVTRGDTKIGTTGINGGIWIGKEGTTDHYAKTEDVIIFFGAKFQNVAGGDTYSTDTISFVYGVE